VLLIDLDDRALGGDDLRPDEVVAGGRVGAHEPADATTEGEARDAGVADDPRGGGKAGGLGRFVELAVEKAGIRVRDPACHGNCLEPSQVDDQSSLTHGLPADAVTAAAHS
jgi:hypothetical protein